MVRARPRPRVRARATVRDSGPYPERPHPKEGWECEEGHQTLIGVRVRVRGHRRLVYISVRGTDAAR